MTEDKDFFVGIDLGTTNSSIHWGAVDPTSNRIEPRPLNFDQQNSEGAIIRRALLPSYIWFVQGDELPSVGEYARTRGLEAQPSRVARDIKNYIGLENWRFEVDNKEYSAAELSAILLKTMYNGIIKTWGEIVDDVVITVPASFDSDMRNDTYEAVKLSGFKVKERDGSTRNLLLDEPRAALYDLINQQLSGHLPPNLILDLSTPKIVMVFDLGGGTLDVSLHRVKQSSDVDEIGVDDLAISRYTQLGGGIFDKLIADELQQRFEDRNKLKLDDLSLVERHQLRTKLEIQAEQVKIRLTNDIDHRYNPVIDEIPDDFSVDIEMPFVYDNKGLFTNLTKGEFDSLISPLLASDLTINALNRFEDLPYTADNIIYPVLDVLHKGKKKLEEPLNVDALILNGGMTRVHSIQKRLQDFFNITPITVLDPEHAVSRGAAIYHHLLHRGWRPHQILAESIGVEVEDSRIFHLVPAGTVLPFQQKISGKFSIPLEGTDRLDIPLYRGEKYTPEPPNKKILERRFIFDNSQRLGTPIDVEISIDKNKIVDFTACLPNGEKAEVQVGAEETFEDEEDVDLPLDKVSKKRHYYKPTGPSINSSKFRDDFQRLSFSWDEVALKKLGQSALQAKNCPELIDVLIDDHQFFSRPAKQRIMWLLGEYGGKYGDQERIPKIVAVSENNIRLSLGNEKAVATVGRNAVHALGKIGSSVAESYLVSIVDDPRVQPIRADIFVALGKCGATLNSMRHIQPYIESIRDGERIFALWALGKLGSREHVPVIPMNKIEDMITHIGQRAFPNVEKHVTARNYAVYALGEFGDRRTMLGHQDFVSDEYSEYILKVLSKTWEYAESRISGSTPSKIELRQIRKLLQISKKQVEGDKLTNDETRVLMRVRTLMSVKA